MGDMAYSSWKRSELILLILYAVVFYGILVYRSLQLTHDHSGGLSGLRQGWIFGRLNDLSDMQWRNFRGNLPILTFVFGVFTIIANAVRHQLKFQGRGMSFVWIMLSLSYLLYLHGACVAFLLLIASSNFFLVKIFVRFKYYPCVLWIFNIAVLLLNRVYEGYSFSSFGKHLAFLDNHRGTFRWHICFNLVVLRMISFGCDYCWAYRGSKFDQEKHMHRCTVCSSGKACYTSLQDRGVDIDKYTFDRYLCYLIFAPLYIAGPIASFNAFAMQLIFAPLYIAGPIARFNAFAMQLDMPQKSYSLGQITWYGLRWMFSFLLMEVMTHFFYYNAFAISGLWKQLSPLEIFIIGYGVLNFMWLKFLLIWRFFRFWSLIGGIETPENMPRCINNCHDLESFWKSWHSSYNRWLVRYMYIPLGGAQRKLLNVWVIFTFVAVWHDLEWKLISWAWLTCVFLVPEIVIKSAVRASPARSVLGALILRELSAVGGAITISCLMVANLAGYVIGPSGIKWLISRLLQKDGLPVLGGIFTSFYVGTKLMFHIRDAKRHHK